MIMMISAQARTVTAATFPPGHATVTNENRKAAPRLRPFGDMPTNHTHRDVLLSSLVRLSAGNWNPRGYIN